MKSGIHTTQWSSLCAQNLSGMHEKFRLTESHFETYTRYFVVKNKKQLKMSYFRGASKFKIYFRQQLKI